MNNYLKRAVFLFVVFTCLASLAHAYEMRYPFRDSKGNDKIIQCFENFGAFRQYSKTRRGFHKGIDLSTTGGTKIYPVAAGEIVFADYLEGSYGYTVIIDHSGWQSHYSHMKGPEEFEKIKKSRKLTTEEANLLDYIKGFEKKLAKGEKPSVDVDDWIGLEWNTGNSKGHHLHFGVGAPTVFNSSNTAPDPNNLLNPITAGLKQPNHSGGLTVTNQPNAYLRDVYFVDPKGKKGIEWKYLDWMPGKKVRIIAEAYDKVAGEYTSAPYKIAFEVTRLWGTYSESYEIKFDDLKNGNPTAEHYKNIYSLEKPKVSQSALEKGKKRDKFYYYWDWEPPEAGYYGVVVEVYDAYWNSGNLKIEMNETKGTSTEGILLGIGGVFHGLEVGEEEKVSVMDAVTSNLAFSPSPDDTDYVNRTVITAAANLTPEAWTAKIYDSSDNLIKEISAGGGQVVNIEWDGTNSSGWAVDSGTYTYQVEARKGSDTSSPESGTIVVDKTRPNFASGPFLSSSTIRSSTEIISMSFSADEELNGVGVQLYDELDNYISPVMSLPGLKVGETAEFECYRIKDLPNGSYKLKTSIVDNVGNVNETTIYININIPNNDAPPPSFEEPEEEVEGFPDLPSFQPIISDIAFDSSGNQYVLYGRYNKLVKYSSAGDVIKIIDKFDLTPDDLTDDENAKLRLPLGLAVSPSGDRVYVADTYNNRVLIYDGGLKPIRSIRKRDVYSEKRHRYRNLWSFGLHMIDNSNMYTNLEVLEEGYLLPMDVEIRAENVYVVDSRKHRILKYDKSGREVAFDEVKVHIVDENWSSIIGSERKERWFRSNVINDTMSNDYPSGLVGYPSEIDVENASELAYKDIQHLNFIQHYISTEESSADGKFSFPESVAVDKYGNIYIADTANNRIQKFNSDGSFVSKFGEGELNSPKGLDVDAYGNIWVADTGNKRIVQFGPSGDFIKEYKSDEYEIDPQKITVKDGKIYIADANHDEPLVWNIAGEITNVRVSDTWLSPNSDGEKDSINISYNLSQPAKVTIQAVPKSSGDASAMSTTVGVALDNVSRSIGNNEETWNGVVQSAGSSAQSTEDGEANTIADGSYDLKIIASFGDYKKVKTVDVNVDTEKPSLTLTRDPPAISPNADGINDEMLIEYSVTDSLSPTSEVRTSLWKRGKINERSCC